MRAARLHAVGERLRVEDVPEPTPADGEVVVEVMAAGLCGSDVHIQEGRTLLDTYPLTLGHESAGIVRELGPRVDGWAVGDRVCINFLLTCGECSYCVAGRPSLCLKRSGVGLHRDGGFAQYMSVPARSLVPLPDNVPFEQGAIATDAVATPYHAITKRMRPRLGESVVVYGIGGLGFHAIKLLSLHGLRPIIAVDVVPRKLARAAEAGADHVLDATGSDPVEATKQLTGGLGAHYALELVGREETIWQAVASVRPGGRAVLVGHGAPQVRLMAAASLVRQEIEVLGAYAFESSEITNVLGLVSAGLLDLSGSITHRVPLEDINTGFAVLKARDQDPVRVVVTNTGGTT